jgi:hypothetical protein
MPQAVSNGIANAWDFAFGLNKSVSPLVLSSSSTSTGSQTYTVELGQTTAADGTVILPLQVNGIVSVGVGPNQETVTITAVTAVTPGLINTCSFTATFANAHGAGEIVVSGSGGVQEAAHNRLIAGGGLVAITPSWFAWAGTSHAAGITALTAYKSLGATVTVLDYSGLTGVFSYSAAANSIYASTTHVLY